jgi:hypothetical protein
LDNLARRAESSAKKAYDCEIYDGEIVKLDTFGTTYTPTSAEQDYFQLAEATCGYISQSANSIIDSYSHGIERPDNSLYCNGGSLAMVRDAFVRALPAAKDRMDKIENGSVSVKLKRRILDRGRGDDEIRMRFVFGWHNLYKEMSELIPRWDNLVDFERGHRAEAGLKPQ